jgi:hypothetical protein
MLTINYINTDYTYLVGSAACHWYFNPVIPQPECFHDRYISI